MSVEYPFVPEGGSILRKTLLLISSSQVLMDITKKILERSGYSVRCAVGFSGAQELLADFSPDGVVLECDLPDIKGLDYIKELRKMLTVPILALSNSKEDELPALQAGASDFLKKPFDFDVLKARIGVMLNMNAVSQTNREGLIDGKSSETPDEAKAADQRRLSRRKGVMKLRGNQLRIAVAACAAFVTVAAAALVIITNNRLFISIPDANTPLARTPYFIEESAKAYTGAERYIYFPVIGNAALDAGSAELEITLYNPEKNSCYFVFEIALAETGETLYTSGLVKPGMCVEDVALSREIETGEYEAVVKIRAFTPKDYSQITSADTGFTLTVNGAS